MDREKEKYEKRNKEAVKSIGYRAGEGKYRNGDFITWGGRKISSNLPFNPNR